MQRIGFVLSPGFQVMSFAALPVFEYANKEMGEPVYDLHLLSEAGGLHAQLDRRQRRDRAVPRHGFRYAVFLPWHRTVDAGPDRILAPGP